MVARKNQFNQQQSAAAITMERSRLIQAKTLAMRRQDYPEVADIEAKLKELPVVQTTREEEESLADKLAKVNERNRKANLEAVRKAELLEAERKRRERKLANAGGSGVATPSDPSARLKTLPRMFNDASRFVLYPIVRGLGFVILCLATAFVLSCAGQVSNPECDWNACHCTATPSKFATYIPTAITGRCELASRATEKQVFRSLRDRKHRNRPRGLLKRGSCIRLYTIIFRDALVREGAFSRAFTLLTLCFNRYPSFIVSDHVSYVTLRVREIARLISVSLRFPGRIYLYFVALSQCCVRVGRTRSCFFTSRHPFRATTKMSRMIPRVQVPRPGPGHR